MSYHSQNSGLEIRREGIRHEAYQITEGSLLDDVDRKFTRRPACLGICCLQEALPKMQLDRSL